MSKKHFSWLLGLTVIVAVAVFLLPRETARDSGLEASALLPGLEEKVNDIDWLRISAEGETIATLARRDGNWVVEEAHGYAADWPQVHGLLSDLAGAQVIEAKTSNPDYYDRLGVEDPGSSGAAGVLIEFRESAGLPSVIAGNTAQGRGGQYLRLADSAQSVLVDRELEISRGTGDWLDNGIIDISENEVVEVAVTPLEGEPVLIRKISADDQNFELQNIPEGHEPKSGYTVNSLAGGLSSLTLDDVVPAQDLAWNEAVGYRLLTADGLNVEAVLLEVPAEEGGSPAHWIRLEAGLYTTTVDAGVDPDGAGETAKRAEEINQRVAGWAYRIPQYKFSSMNKRMADLVQAIEADS